MRQSSDETARALRAEVDAFVASHFRLAGTLRLHAAALGWDLLRAPLNVALAPIYLATLLAGLVARLIGLRRFGGWLRARRILMPTAVSRQVQARIEAELLGGMPLTPRSRRLIEDYAAVRSAVAEITTSLVVLATGLVLFGAATPGITSLTPTVSGYIVHSSAVTNFPLGSRVGEVWYGVFPVTQPVWFVVTTGVVLAMAASLVTTFAGIVADPLQAATGLHRRRLVRLLDKVAAAEGQASGLAPEHILARLADITDAGISVVRLFRP